ncbi:MAG TPA: AMP-binding protein [Solirubrobacteraceae bacterium]|nr:AMP-binding protein [Solirubrobacteraceae bacterium]
MNTRVDNHLARVAEAAFERHGDYPTLLFDGRWHTSGEIFHRSQRLAGGFAALDVEPGERVVVTMANCAEVSIAYQALWRVGAAVTPCTFVLSATELRHVLNDSGACGVVTTPDLLDKVVEAVSGADTVRFVVCTGESAGNATRFSSLEQSEPIPIVERANDDLAALLYTGGTTGRAKGVMLSHANLAFCAKTGLQASHVDGVTDALVTVPLSHAFGLLFTISAAFMAEPPVNVLMPWFEPTAALELIQEHRIHKATLVPSMIQMLLGQELEHYDLSSLVDVACGSAPLPRTVATEFERRVPSATIREGYGLTESSALIATNRPGARKLGSVGQPLPGVTMTILDNAGRELPAGEPGEICCRSPGVMLGYWRAPEATEDALRGGWLHTGDVGYVDDDGFIFIVDRIKDLIIRGGFNVYPRDVEDALTEHPGVAAAGVVGRPDPRFGEEVVAFVSLTSAGAVDAEALVAWARERLGGYKYPREARIVDALPRTPVGKLDRKALRKLLE